MLASTSTIVIIPIINWKFHRKYLTRQKDVLLLVWPGNNSNNQGIITGTAVLPNLHLLIQENSKYITLSDADQHSTRIRCFFIVNKAAFLIIWWSCSGWCSNSCRWYSILIEQKRGGMYKELLDNLTANIFLATSSDHEFLIITEIPCYILLLNPESQITSTSKILLPVQQAICGYHLQIPVTPTPNIQWKKKICSGRICKSNLKLHYETPFKMFILQIQPKPEGHMKH